MDSLLTQGLIGIVFVLSVALWSKSASSSSSSSSTSKEASASQKTKKKKKKGGNATSSDIPPTSIADKTATVAAKVEQLAVPALSEEKPVEEVKTISKPVKSSASNGSKKANGTASKKKMTLEDFATKTNEERVEEIERAARGDAGEKDLGGDMIDKDLQPEIPYKKTVRIEPAFPKLNHVARSYEDGWESVGGKAKIAQPVIASTKTNNVVPSNAWASSNPFALLPGSGAEPVRMATSASKPSSANTSSTNANAAAAAAHAQTKKQRQNAAKTQAKKAEKETMEAERLARLAQHKKQVEAERMKDYFKKQSSSGTAPFSTHQNGNNKAAFSTGTQMAKASVNEKGSLVWD